MKDIVEQFGDNNIRFIDTETERLVCVKDVLETLGYKDSRGAWFDMKKGVEKVSNRSVVSKQQWYPELGRAYATDFVNEDQVLIILMKCNLPSTIPFMQWVLKIIKKELRYNTLAGTEQEISNALGLLASRSRNNMVFEQSEESDYLYGVDRHGLPRCKRYDIVQDLGRLYRIYEIKKGVLTSSEAFNTVQKDYLELAAIIKPGKKLELVMVAPGIEQGAKDYLNRLGAETKYKEFTIKDINYMAKIRYIHVNDFAMELYNKAVNKCPKGGLWHLQEFAVKYCHSVFNEIQLQQLKKGLFLNPKPIYYLEAN